MNTGNVAIFASGGGSNALKIIECLENDKDWGVALIITNKSDAGVIRHAEKHRVPHKVFTRDDFNAPGLVVNYLKKYRIEFVVLAGFLLKVPDEIVAAFPNKIINIHPALLPDFGGKGMYGDFVHAAVLDAGRKISGITIHYVNNHYDEGQIIFQASTPVSEDDSVASLRQKVQALEHRYFPKVLSALLHHRDIPEQDED
jgi:phosphoribosylglycinamide formyltransferase-1